MVDKKTTEEKKLDKMISEVETFINKNKTPKPNIGLKLISMQRIVDDGKSTVTSLELSLKSMKLSKQTSTLKGRLTEFNIKFNKLDATLKEIQAKSILAGEDSDENSGVNSLMNFDDSDEEDESAGFISNNKRKNADSPG